MNNLNLNMIASVPPVNPTNPTNNQQQHQTQQPSGWASSNSGWKKPPRNGPRCLTFCPVPSPLSQVSVFGCTDEEVFVPHLVARREAASIFGPLRFYRPMPPLPEPKVPECIPKVVIAPVVVPVPVVQGPVVQYSEQSFLAMWAASAKKPSFVSPPVVSKPDPDYSTYIHPHVARFQCQPDGTIAINPDHVSAISIEELRTSDIHRKRASLRLRRAAGPVPSRVIKEFTPMFGFGGKVNPLYGSSDPERKIRHNKFLQRVVDSALHLRGLAGAIHPHHEKYQQHYSHYLLRAKLITVPSCLSQLHCSDCPADTSLEIIKVIPIAVIVKEEVGNGRANLICPGTASACVPVTVNVAASIPAAAAVPKPVGKARKIPVRRSKRIAAMKEPRRSARLAAK
ncbi:hypothetical protein BDR26DRAFT_893225 [Obelidium mucronatum]|nr:hypothetical protein BDR26DRAFT_893225 [Obelidium mucronatum]